jgi:hypothetical protein
VAAAVAAEMDGVHVDVRVVFPAGVDVPDGDGRGFVPGGREGTVAVEMISKGPLGTERVGKNQKDRSYISASQGKSSSSRSEGAATEGS